MQNLREVLSLKWVNQRSDRQIAPCWSNFCLKWTRQDWFSLEILIEAARNAGSMADCQFNPQYPTEGSAWWAFHRLCHCWEPAYDQDKARVGQGSKQVYWGSMANNPNADTGVKLSHPFPFWTILMFRQTSSHTLLPLFWFFFLLATCQYALAETISGRVVGVHDGDTLTLLMAGNQQLKIRLAQIDAPESSQGFGRVSKQSLSDLVFGKDVSVEVETIDKYGRTVGKVLVGGTDANLEQIKGGMAWVFLKYAHDRAYYAAEKSAKAKGVGLWSQPNPIPPWEFRHPGDYATRQPSISQSTSVQFSGVCGGKLFCRQMSSCEEAKFYLTQCGLTRLDRDGDGIPCESLCK